MDDKSSTENGLKRSGLNGPGSNKFNKVIPKKEMNPRLLNLLKISSFQGAFSVTVTIIVLFRLAAELAGGF